MRHLLGVGSIAEPPTGSRSGHLDHGGIVRVPFRSDGAFSLGASLRMPSLPAPLPSPKGERVTEALAASRWYSLGPIGPGVSSRSSAPSCRAPACARRRDAPPPAERPRPPEPGGSPIDRAGALRSFGTPRGEVGRRGSWEPSRRGLCAIILAQNA